MCLSHTQERALPGNPGEHVKIPDNRDSMLEKGLLGAMKYIPATAGDPGYRTMNIDARPGNHLRYHS